jgi:hypothetical protein
MKRTRNLLIASIAILTVFAAAVVTTTNAQSTNVTGKWNLTIETQAGTGNPSVTLKQEGEQLTGNYKGRFGEAPLKGTVKGKDIQFSFKVDAQGQELQVEYSGAVDGDTMKGKVKFGDFAEGTFTGKKE